MQQCSKQQEQQCSRVPGPGAANTYVNTCAADLVLPASSCKSWMFCRTRFCASKRCPNSPQHNNSQRSCTPATRL